MYKCLYINCIHTYVYIYALVVVAVYLFAKFNGFCIVMNEWINFVNKSGNKKRGKKKEIKENYEKVIQNVNDEY